MAYHKNWLVLRESPCIRKKLALWRGELTQKLRSEAFLVIKEEAATGKEASRRIAAEWLAKASWRKQEGTKRKAGAPSKDEIKGELAHRAEVTKEELADAKRIGLN